MPAVRKPAKISSSKDATNIKKDTKSKDPTITGMTHSKDPSSSRDTRKNECETQQQKAARAATPGVTEWTSVAKQHKNSNVK
jgi:hypothetical protein